MATDKKIELLKRIIIVAHQEKHVHINTFNQIKLEAIRSILGAASEYLLSLILLLFNLLFVIIIYKFFQLRFKINANY